mgnify:CR=1 FL=1
MMGVLMEMGAMFFKSPLTPLYERGGLVPCLRSARQQLDGNTLFPPFEKGGLGGISRRSNNALHFTESKQQRRVRSAHRFFRLLPFLKFKVRRAHPTPSIGAPMPPLPLGGEGWGEGVNPSSRVACTSTSRARHRT